MADIIPNIQFKHTAKPDVGLEVLELSDLYEKLNSPSHSLIKGAHRINFHNLILITNGAGQHFVDFHSFPVQKGSVIMINKGQVHAFDLENKPQGKLIVFTDEYLVQANTLLSLSAFGSSCFFSSNGKVFNIGGRVSKSVLALVSLISEEFEGEQVNTYYLKMLFSSLLTKTSENNTQSYFEHMSVKQIEYFETFMNHLEQNYCHNHEAKSYAENIGVTYKTLNTLCKLATNKTAKQLIDAYLILEAKRRLVTDKIQVQQLADFLGFDEPSNFVKYFKKHTLMTPSQFKKSY